MMRTFFGSAILAGCLLGLTACSGGGNNGTSIPNQISGTCDPGTQVQLANPISGQSGVSTNPGSVVVVANGNNNTLGNTFQSWNVVLQDNFGNQFAAGNLVLATRPGNIAAPGPYPSDFYYSSSISNLSPGRTYSVGLNIFTSNCNPLFIGSFST
ncbi:MAG: hypothetical protein GIW95_07860 [Candidatus Eremiobacteraeota bacterium]|nr:hypothetical protein [Candidatus Eremiobacteraeota bacterium]